MHYGFSGCAWKTTGYFTERRYEKMNCHTVKSDYIRQNGEHCGYIIMQQTNGEYWTELYLFGISGCVIREKTANKDTANEIYTDLLNTYNY